ncbi:hypothetical protein FTUN_7928 [Frigoriglobus tundricola]|uniref:Uncharacterized protein n=1 Tax=Frigoriglobus tundricola TaxID=2774151 RepID=A0A6M5Z4Z6_9BACT|nr:hypothetical protein FTUN_7928 [Frigoriglobus tundricola]
MRDEPLSLDDDGDDYRHRRAHRLPAWVWIGAAIAIAMVAIAIAILLLRRSTERGGESADRNAAPFKRSEASGTDVTGAEIETFGAELVGKPCVMTCRFHSVSDIWVRLLLRDESYVGFFVTDSKGDLFQWVFASKERHGRKLIAMRRGNGLKLVGRVKRSSRRCGPSITHSW